MLNVLVLEDNVAELYYCCALIKRVISACTIFKAMNGEDALKLIEEHSIDLFFLDVKMPGMNGFEFAEKVRENPNYRLTTIVFITGVQTDQLAVHKKYHHYEYLEKPVTVASFEKQIKPLVRELNRIKVDDSKSPKLKREKLVLIEAHDMEVLVKAANLLYVESNRRTLTAVVLDEMYGGCKIYTNIKMSLESFIHEVDDPFFIRCHKSFGVNVKQIFTIQQLNRRIWAASFHPSVQKQAQISETYYYEVHHAFLKQAKMIQEE